jgi:uncharacterized protein DUF3995
MYGIVLLRSIVALVLVALFLALAALHLYWAFGGRWGASVAIPELDGRPAFRPGRVATLAVALLLCAAAGIVALRANAIPGPGAARELVRLGAWTLSAVFALRAIGNRDTFGFLKVTRDTAFSRYDTWLFSPLCLTISLGCLLVALGR